MLQRRQGGGEPTGRARVGAGVSGNGVERIKEQMRMELEAKMKEDLSSECNTPICPSTYLSTYLCIIISSIIINAYLCYLGLQ